MCFFVAMLVTTSRLSPVVHPAIKRLPLTESRPLDATMAQSTPVTPRAERPAPAPGVPWEQRQSINDHHVPSSVPKIHEMLE